MAYPTSPSPELVTPVTWLRLLGSWSMVVLFMIFGGQWLGDSLNGTTAAIVFLALFVTILAASFGVVREADHLAHQL
ncbi:MAG: calcium:proton antiporter, partial [Alcaligenes faecalis]|nr:calcium:proton antiporter [Alcaligenes faecalis]